MGEIRAKVKLENLGDLVLYKHGHLKKNQLRHEEISILVDTGAVEILLPQDLVENLGLDVIQKKVTVCLADDRKIELSRAGSIQITVCDREMVTDCLVGPPGCEPLLGQLVMERLDLVLNPRKKTITVNPESPYQPTLKMK